MLGFENKHGFYEFFLRVINPYTSQLIPLKTGSGGRAKELEAKNTEQSQPASLCSLLQVDFLLKADRVVQSVKAICNALAAVETPEITSALNQLPPCPSRMQPKIQKVKGSSIRWGSRAFTGNAAGYWVIRCALTKVFSPLPSFMLR